MSKAGTLTVRSSKLGGGVLYLPGAHAVYPKPGNRLYFHYDAVHNYDEQTTYHDTRAIKTPALKYSFIVEAEAALHYKDKNGSWFMIPLLSSIYNGRVYVRVKFKTTEDAETFFGCSVSLAVRNGENKHDTHYPNSHLPYGWKQLGDREFVNYANRLYAAGFGDDHFLSDASAKFDRDYYYKKMTLVGKGFKRYHPCILADTIDSWIDERRPSVTVEEAEAGRY
ncbi:hypothetical protein [Selenomonas sp. AE3005]|uniref:hypothetical protein n=1 Tax=Selenomonas sp. AE3005 TaxID=1485543 RepID=UPI000482CA46|nr:hypothetical protein [Selenomonas sp. AE3005]